MDEPTLEKRVEAVFQFAFGCAANRPALTKLHQKLIECYQPLNQPMRLAIVGTIKAGKSTLMNALLGEEVVATGTVEATFNVNLLQYGERPSLRVFYKDKRPPEPKSFVELKSITIRADENRDYLLSIEYIEVSYPNPILKTLNLIDTPGLESHYKDDSDNTLAFLNIHGQELTKITQAEARKADAVLYLFDKSIAESDRDAVAQFQGATLGQASPINAIGVLTKVDSYWSDGDKPLVRGEAIIHRLQSDHSQLSNRFYTIRPVCGLLAFGTQTMTGEEFNTLTELAKLSQERFEKLVRNAERFSEREYPNEPAIPSAPKRKPLLSRLGQYGVWLACSLIREHQVQTQKDLSSEMLKQSGILELQRLIKAHFGNRASLIKLNTTLEKIKAACFMERQHLDGVDYQLVIEIEKAFSELEAEEQHSFQELQILRLCYQEQLSFNQQEVRQLLNVVGENGISIEERLGLSANSPNDQTIRVAKERVQYWSQRANDLMSADSQTLDAARVLLHSYERILYHLKQRNRSYV
ncbi:dynamin family protein [Planktothrix sp. FACHB-1365]|uniref:dynamin family protein n=1 Tax=Planktothrix sp. FACHB-1365 TaxID=2692855 RepID=UPI0016830F5C|nr:dynamin family protein [Planktothrix sp. FACHB-1365]MBD2483941.1 dynamin family protein [Planktothrix sp. FACHB-1365]